MSRRSWNKLGVGKNIREVLKMYRFLDERVNDGSIEFEVGLERLKRIIISMMKKCKKYWDDEDFGKF